MNRKQLKKLWESSKKDRKFHRLAMLAGLVCVPSPAKDQSGACALANFTLRKAGSAGRRDLRGRLKTMGWEF